MPELTTLLTSRVLVKDGSWQVAAKDRPLGWERFGLSEPLDAVIEATQQRTVDNASLLRCQFDEFRAAIREDAVEFGATPDIEIAAELLVAGMFTRDHSELAVLLGVPIDRVKVIACRYIDAAIWQDGNRVVLGNLEGFNGFLEFWLIAMTGAGHIKGKYEDNGMMMFRANNVM